MRGLDRGSSPVEFVLVGALLTVLTLAVVQFALAVYVRNVVHDAAVEGAFFAALADVDPRDGAERAQAIVARTIGPGFVTRARAAQVDVHGMPMTAVTVSATLPLIGTMGIPDAWEVTARAPTQQLGR